MISEIDPYNVEALERSVNDSSVRVSTLWVSYLIFGLYLSLTVIGVTPRQIFFDEPLKLPLLNIDLPLYGFFIVTPVLFVLLHVYVLLQVLLLGRTASAYNDALKNKISTEIDRGRIRQRLSNTLFAQIFAGSPRKREGLLGSLLKIGAWFVLVVGPISILLAFNITFLRFHSYVGTWIHRSLVAIDLLAIILLWSSALKPDQEVRWALLLANWKQSLTALMVLSAACAFASFPGEFQARWTRQFEKKQDTSAGRYEVCSGTSILSSLISTSFDRIALPGVIVADADALAKIESSTSKRHLPAYLGERTHDFSGRDFTCGDFTGADLRRANFSGAVMTGADFDGAVMQGASLERAQLSHASLESADLESANLSKTDLRAASLTGARMLRADLEGANLQGTDLSGSALIDATLVNLNLQGANLVGVRLQGTMLESSSLEGASFERAQLYGALFKHAKLQAVSFADAGLQGAWFIDAKLEGSSFSGARLQGVTFVDTDLHLVDFSDTYLWHTASPKECQEVLLENASFDPVIGRATDRSMVPATGDGLEELINLVESPIPDERRQSFRDEMKRSLAEGTDEIGLKKSWMDCAATTNSQEFRERMVAYLLAMTCTNRELATMEGIAVNTAQRPYSKAILAALSNVDEASCAAISEIRAWFKNEIQSGPNFD